MRRFLKFLSASLKMTYRERIALFWIFLFPLLLMLLLGAIFGRTGNTEIKLGVVDLDRSLATSGVIKALGDIKAFEIEQGSEAELKKKLNEGNLNAVLVLQEGFFDSMTHGRPGEATIYVDKSSVTVADITYSSVSQVLDKIAQGMAGMPTLIEVKKESVVSSELSYVDFMVPGILAITLMTSGLMGLSLSFVNYREKGILRRIKVSPLPLSRFLGSELTAALLISLVQAAILLVVGMLVFKINIRGNILYIAVVVLIGAASFLALGFLIASLTKTLKTAEMASNVVSFPMMFLSGVFFPLAIMPAFLVTIAKLLPLYYLGHALREVMIRGRGLTTVWFDLMILVVMGVICFLVSVKLFRWE